jgi:hypothetical protein
MDHQPVCVGYLLSENTGPLPKSACSCRQLQNIRLSSDVPNPWNRSRNYQADGDGCVGFRLQVPRRRAQGCNGFHGQRLIAKKRRTAFFVSPVAPTFCSARCRSTPTASPGEDRCSDRILIAANRCAALRTLKVGSALQCGARCRCATVSPLRIHGQGPRLTCRMGPCPSRASNGDTCRERLLDRAAVCTGGTRPRRAPGGAGAFFSYTRFTPLTGNTRFTPLTGNTRFTPLTHGVVALIQLEHCPHQPNIQ